MFLGIIALIGNQELEEIALLALKNRQGKNAQVNGRRIFERSTSDKGDASCASYITASAMLVASISML